MSNLEPDFEDKSISEDEVSECISEKVDDGVPQEQAVAICLSEAEEGSAEPVNREISVDSEKKSVLEETILVPDQLLYREESTAMLVAEMLELDGVHTHELNGTIHYMPGESHEQFFEVLGEPGVNGLVDENMENDTVYGDEEEEDSKSLDNPQFEVGDFVRWDFATGSATGEVFNMETEEGEGFSLDGTERIASEDNGPAYEIQEWDENEGEDGEFTNRVIKVESELRDATRPDAAPESAPRNRAKSAGSREKKRVNFRVKGSNLELTKEEDGEVFVNVPIQATSEDRDGDVITDKGQERILEQLESGEVPLVPNHGVGAGAATYDFRDIFGQFVGGEMMDGTTVGRARLREGSEMADELQDLLEQDMPVGFSVGFIPTETEERGEGGMLVDDLDLMEVSAVGVPSNPDAVPQAMGGAVAAAKQAGLDRDEIVSRVEKAFESVDTGKQGDIDAGSQRRDAESLKMMTSENVESAMSVISSVMSEAISEAMDEAEDELMGMVDEDSEMEEDEMDEDEDEDMDTDATHGDEEDEEEMGLDDSDKTVSEGSSDKTIQGVDDSSVQDDKNQKEDEDVSLMSEPEGSAWGTTV